MFASTRFCRPCCCASRPSSHPGSTGRAERAARLAWQAAGGVGLALLLVNLSALAWPLAPPDWRGPFIRLVGAQSYYYLTVYALSIAALLWLVLRAWGARAQERHRVLVFTAGPWAGHA